MSKNPVRNYAAEYLASRGITEERATAIAAAAVAGAAVTGTDLFGDVSGTTPGPIQVHGLLGSPIDGPAADGDVPQYDEVNDQWALVDIASLVAGGGMVPYFIADGDTFTVPELKQATYAIEIDVEGTLAVDGYLVEVD